jgi:molybdate transport repressor ModE-like protein
VTVDRCLSITLRQLQVFTAVAREQSFVRAADALYLSQPSISDQIKALEQLLGIRLLLRRPGGKRVVLTEAGEVLLATFDDITARLKHADRALDALRRLEDGRVAFGAEPSFGTYLLPRLYRDFHRRYPGITVSQEVTDGSILLEGLRQARLDLAVVVGPVADRTLAAELLATYHILLVGRPAHRLANGGPYPFAELASEDFILPTRRFVVRQLIEQLAASSGVALRIAMEASHVAARVQAVTDGIGITPIDTYAAANGIAAGNLVPLQVQGFPLALDWCITYRPGELDTAPDAFRRHLLTHAAELDDQRLLP